MPELSTEDLIKKWPIGKVVELSSEARTRLIGLLWPVNQLSKLMNELKKHTDCYDQITDEMVNKIRGDIPEAVGFVEKFIFGGKELTPDILKRSEQLITMRFAMYEAIAGEARWGIVYVDLMKSHNMVHKEFNSVSFKMSVKNPGIIRVTGYTITENDDEDDEYEGDEGEDD